MTEEGKFIFYCPSTESNLTYVLLVILLVKEKKMVLVLERSLTIIHKWHSTWKCICPWSWAVLLALLLKEFNCVTIIIYSFPASWQILSLSSSMQGCGAHKYEKYSLDHPCFHHLTVGENSSFICYCCWLVSCLSGLCRHPTLETWGRSLSPSNWR